MDSFFGVSLIAVIIIGLVLASSVQKGWALDSTNIGGIISQDTTWTPSGSPYTLTKDTLIDQGVTLNIQPGVTVNLGSHNIEVNGTLSAMGTSNNPIQFNEGSIIFTTTCNGYNKQTGSGCIIENGILNATVISCNNSTKINQCIMTALVNGQFGIVSYSSVSGMVSGDVVSYSTIMGDVSANTILNNNMMGDVTPYASAQNNNITGSVKLVGNCIFSNNFVQGNINISSGTSTVSSNTIISADTAIDIAPSSDMDYIETMIKNNQIAGAQIGINLESDLTPAFYGWSTRATILLNTISSCSIAGILVNSDDNQAAGSYAGGNKATIIENIISNNTYGIQANANSTIQGNLIINNQYGVLGGIITENTIIRNGIGVLGTNCSYNNIQNSSQYNFALGEFGNYSFTGNFDATNNWWGTNDTQAISRTIYDSKNDSDLGNVTYEPFLTFPNSAAPSQDYTITAGSTITPLKPFPSSAPPTPTSPESTTSPIPTSTSSEFILIILSSIIIAIIAIIALVILLMRRKQHERFR